MVHTSCTGVMILSLLILVIILILIATPRVLEAGEVAEEGEGRDECAPCVETNMII